MVAVKVLPGYMGVEWEERWNFLRRRKERRKTSGLEEIRELVPGAGPKAEAMVGARSRETCEA